MLTLKCLSLRKSDIHTCFYFYCFTWFMHTTDPNHLDTMVCPRLCKYFSLYDLYSRKKHFSSYFLWEVKPLNGLMQGCQMQPMEPYHLVPSAARGSWSWPTGSMQGALYGARCSGHSGHSDCAARGFCSSIHPRVAAACSQAHISCSRTPACRPGLWVWSGLWTSFAWPICFWPHRYYLIDFQSCHSLITLLTILWYFQRPLRSWQSNIEFITIKDKAFESHCIPVLKQWLLNSTFLIRKDWFKSPGRKPQFKLILIRFSILFIL